MPRIRVKTPAEIRFIGTQNCSGLTVSLEGQNQRDTLQIRAEATLIGGESIIEQLRWDFDEIPVGSTVELTSMPDSDVASRFDPPDAATRQARPESLVKPVQAIEVDVDFERDAVLAELQKVADQLARRNPEDPHEDITRYCYFCGRSRLEVNRMVASPKASICDSCIHDAVELIAGP
jgi:hypothetical protein